MNVAILTDSTADLSPDQAAAAGITVVPLYVRFGSDEYRAGIDLTTEGFWQTMLAPGAAHPTTAAPSPGDFRAAFEAAFTAGADAIVCPTIGHKLSATFQSAALAAETCPNARSTSSTPDRPRWPPGSRPSWGPTSPGRASRRRRSPRRSGAACPTGTCSSRWTRSTICAGRSAVRRPGRRGLDALGQADHHRARRARRQPRPAAEPGEGQGRGRRRHRVGPVERLAVLHTPTSPPTRSMPSADAPRGDPWRGGAGPGDDRADRRVDRAAPGAGPDGRGVPAPRLTRRPGDRGADQPPRRFRRLAGPKGGGPPPGRTASRPSRAGRRGRSSRARAGRRAWCRRDRGPRRRP